MPNDSAPDRTPPAHPPLTAFEAGRKLAAKWSHEDVFDFLTGRANELFPGSPLRGALLQAALRNAELYDALLDVVAHDRGSVAMMLSRPQLETAALLVWASLGNDRGERSRRFRRILASGIKEARQRYPAYTVPPELALIEDEALPNPPNARNAMESIDASRRQRGETAFFDSHYSHYALACSHLHSLLFGPATFSELPTGAVVWDRRDDRFLAKAAQRYGAQYFVLSLQGLFALLEMTKVTCDIEKEGRVVVDLAHRELLEVGSPTKSGWIVRR